MSNHYIAIPNYNGFSNFANNQLTPATSNSENPSAYSSPPCPRPGENQVTSNENRQQSNALADDDDLGEDDILDVCQQPIPTDSKSQLNYNHYAGAEPKLTGTQGSKLKATTAERRATHNAIERARRESLNARFLELARALPTMHNVKRPSKSVIVNKSLEWICESQMREYELVRENMFLRNHVNELRAQLQLEPLPSSQLMMYHPVSFKPPEVGALESHRKLSATASYPLSSQKQLSSERPHGFSSKQQHPLAASNISEGIQALPAPQCGINRQPTTAGPFAVPHSHGPTNYLSPTVYDSSDGSEKPPEEVKGLGSQRFESTSNDEKISSLYLPGLSIRTDSGSPFQTFSEPEAPASTVGSSPTRMRYFSSSSGSETSDNSPSRFEYPHAAASFEMERKNSAHAPTDLLIPGTLQGEVLTGITQNDHTSRSDASLPIEPIMVSRPTELDNSLSSIQCHTSNQVPFPPSEYVDSMKASQEAFIPINNHPVSFPLVPRGSVNHGPSLNSSSMLAMSPAVHPGGTNELPNSFPMGTAWVWG